MSGLTLSAITPTVASPPALVAVEQGGKVLRVERGELAPLVIAKRADGALVLAREITRKGKDGAADTVTLKPSALLADMADAIARGLLAP